MKKGIIKLIFVLLLVVLVIVGKNIIDKKTFKYEETVEKSLSSYMVSGNISELDPIIELLDDYANDDTIRNDIQSYSFNFLGNWYTYLDGKFKCDRYNLNSCKVQLDEFRAINNKLQGLYSLKSEEGYSIIVTSAYNNLSSEGNKKVEGLEKLVASPNIKNPDDYETERQEKCAVAVDCESCRDGVCTCYYLDQDRNREELTCQKDIAN